MLDFLTLSANLPFTIALAIMGVLLAVEMLSFLSGLGAASGFLHGLMPEMGDVDGAEVGASFADRFLGWLLLGRVPALILLAILLSAFGTLGLLLQGLLRSNFGFMLPGWMAALIVLPLCLPFVRVIGLGVARVMPRDETQVASRHSLLGHVATIVLGSARRGSPAQAKVRDDVGQTQYVMVEPVDDGEVFQAGDPVLLRSQHGATFRATRPDHPALTP